MKIQLIPEKIIGNVPSEEQLLDYHTLESLYVIRTLKALSESQEKGYIEVNNINSSNQRFSDKYQIWFSEDTFNML